MSEEQTDAEVVEPPEPIVIQQLRERFSDHILTVIDQRGELSVVVDKDASFQVLEFLKVDFNLSYDFLVDVTAIDYSQMEDVLIEYGYARYMVVYHLNAFLTNERLRVKVPVSEKDFTIKSVVALWNSANWLEREIYDMFGINFDGHPDLRRILMPDDFEGFPLRKDYPLRGRGEREKFNFGRENV
ncbi:NADH-quinone oxidoreductase subunit C [Candidatus Poribacteria bacterium]|nr:NADH-quinone oxidoreductase subunit C [Candidatus Poribacteria bacterium]